VNIPEDRIREALKVILGTEMPCNSFMFCLCPDLMAISLIDARNHPVLIHCKRGKVSSLIMSCTQAVLKVPNKL
jgi:protein tyrosine/serine phosphatase